MLSTVPVLVTSVRIRKVTARAQRRANKAGMPNRYMNLFESCLAALLADGEEAMLSRTLGWQDPVRVAAEAEALCAYRALKYWGTDQGLYRPGKHRRQSLQLDEAA